MNQKENWEESINEALDQSIDDLSPSIKNQLAAARAEASSRLSPATPFWRNTWHYAAACSLLLSFGLAWFLLPSTLDQVDNASFGDGSQEIADAQLEEVPDEDFELLNELEFVYWMSEEDQHANI